MLFLSLAEPTIFLVDPNPLIVKTFKFLLLDLISLCCKSKSFFWCMDPFTSVQWIQSLFLWIILSLHMICGFRRPYFHQCCGARAEESKLRITALAPDLAPYPYHFIKDSKKYLEKSHGCINPFKKMVIFKIPNKTVGDKKKSKGRKNVRVWGGAGAEIQIYVSLPRSRSRKKYLRLRNTYSLRLSRFLTPHSDRIQFTSSAHYIPLFAPAPSVLVLYISVHPLYSLLFSGSDVSFRSSFWNLSILSVNPLHKDKPD